MTEAGLFSKNKGSEAIMALKSDPELGGGVCLLYLCVDLPPSLVLLHDLAWQVSPASVEREQGI